MDSGAGSLAGLPGAGLPHLIVISLVAEATMSAASHQTPGPPIPMSQHVPAHRQSRREKTHVGAHACINTGSHSLTLLALCLTHSRSLPTLLRSYPTPHPIGSSLVGRVSRSSSGAFPDFCFSEWRRSNRL